ncbi:hypothetical protein TRVL_09069 [Trypanosoma vivax]|nr:hypothetical protein TRVL_09069 [Trypanosoma vivax]
MRARIPNQRIPLLVPTASFAARMVSFPSLFRITTQPRSFPIRVRVHVPAFCRRQWRTFLALRSGFRLHLLPRALRVLLRTWRRVAAWMLTQHVPWQPSVASLLATNGPRFCDRSFCHSLASRVYGRRYCALVLGDPRLGFEDAMVLLTDRFVLLFRMLHPSSLCWGRFEAFLWERESLLSNRSLHSRKQQNRKREIHKQRGTLTCEIGRRVGFIRTFRSYSALATHREDD